ncbi:MAG: hypothetical protein AMXMBFR58_28160 [Phycisphaerae bacterium]|nr:DUF393 domain-containing protein [Phycisphaerales bacterium]
MPPEFTILIDGRCHLCVREARFLSRLDRGRGRLAIVDLCDPGFDASRLGVPPEDLLGRIHGVMPDGRIVTGVEVFRRAYAATGHGWLVAWTAWPVIRPVVDRLYLWFARHRMSISAATAWLPGRRSMPACDNGSCRLS